MGTRNTLMPLHTVMRGGATLAEQLAALGFIALYEFNEGSGQVLTDSIGSYDGQLGSTSGVDTNDPTWAASPSRLNHPDTDDYSILPGALETALGSAAMTMFVVFRIGQAGNHTSFYYDSAGQEGCWIKFSGTARTLQFYLIDGGGIGAGDTGTKGATPLNTWGFAAVSYTPSTSLLGWETAAGSALELSVNDTSSVPASRGAMTEILVGDGSLLTALHDIALCGLAPIAFSDVEMTNTVYPLVQSIAAAKGITLP